MLASVVDDLVTIDGLRKTDFERTKRLERVLAATHEPAAPSPAAAPMDEPARGWPLEPAQPLCTFEVRFPQPSDRHQVVDHAREQSAAQLR